MNDLHIVFCKKRTCIVKAAGMDWRGLQEMFPDYMTSLGPWSRDQLVDYWQLDYGDDQTKWPFLREDIESFVASHSEILLESSEEEET